MIALIHSPLVGPFTWEAVAAELRRRGLDVVVPRLTDDERAAQPCWQQHAGQVAAALAKLPPTQPIVWVAHSGAGPRLPSYRRAVPNPAAGYLFVDAGIPHDVPPEGLSQIDLMRREPARAADALLQVLDQGGHFPTWTDEQLREEIPEPATRAALLAELQPHGRRYFAEPIPVFAAWPEAPCAYLHFSAGYANDARYARQHGWPLASLPGSHFEMLVDAPAVTAALLDLLDLLGRIDGRT